MTTTPDDIYINRKKDLDGKTLYLVANNYRTIYVYIVETTVGTSKFTWYDLFDKEGDLLKQTDTLDEAIAHASNLLLLPEYQGYHS